MPSGSNDETGGEPEETASMFIIINDFAFLDCPICFEPLISPVYQCENGHIACASCCTRMANKCPSCRHPIGTIRSRILEKVIESFKVECRNKLYGCSEIFIYNKKHDKLNHEKICCYSPCTCPFNGCNYVGVAESLYKHFREMHSPSTFSFNTVKSISLDVNKELVFLQDNIWDTLFILKRTINDQGSFVGVTFVGPDSMGKDFSYDLTAVIRRDKYVMIKAGVVCARKWSGENVFAECLGLLSDIVSRSEKLKLELIIRRNSS